MWVGHSPPLSAWLSAGAEVPRAEEALQRNPDLCPVPWLRWAGLLTLSHREKSAQQRSRNRVTLRFLKSVIAASCPHPSPMRGAGPGRGRGVHSQGVGGSGPGSRFLSTGTWRLAPCLGLHFLIWSPPQGAAVSSAGNSVLRGHLLPLPLPPAPPPQSWPAHLLGGAAFSWLPSLVLSVDCPVWLGLETSVCCPTFALGPWTPLLQKSKTLGTQALSRSHGKSKFTRQIQGHSW